MLQLLRKRDARLFTNSTYGHLHYIETKQKVFLAVGRVQVRRLVPVRLRPIPNFCPAAVLADTHRRSNILEGDRVRAAHVAAHLRRVVLGVLQITSLQPIRQCQRLRGHH